MAARGTEEQQRLFVTRGRPGAAAVAAVAFGTAAVLSDDRRLDWFLVVLAVSILVTQVPAWLAVRRGVPVGRVARWVLVADIPMVAALTAALGQEGLLVVAYFAPIAFAALIFGPRFTVLLTALASAAALVVGLTLIDVDAVTLLADLVVVVVTGGILAGLSGEMRAAQDELGHERALDATALAISQRVRSTLDLEELLSAMLREIGSTLGVERVLLRMRPRHDGSAPLYQWQAPGLERLHLPQPPAFIRRIFDDAQPRVWHRDEGPEPSVREFLDAVGTNAIVAYPMVWQERVVAVLGCTDAEERAWGRDVLPLFARLSPHLGAALAQAELFEQQQATLAEFRELSRLREQLVANVSHELRTPLTSTLGFLQTLDSRWGEIEDERRRSFVGLALREAERLARLVDDLLDLARLERGVLALDVGPVDLREVVADASRSLDLEGRRLRVELAEGLVASGDRDRLVQVFSNLLQNAARHGAGTITVTADARAGQVAVAIGDGGPGIPSERISDLFVPFAHWSPRGDSTGLGLAIARGIVHAHGGTLFYRPAGGGAEHAFVVTLPRPDVYPASGSGDLSGERPKGGPMPEGKHGPSIKDPELYEELREDGASKEKAARISNEAAAEGRSEVGRRGGSSEDYEDRTVDELRDRAREIGLEGYSNMDKGELIDALRNH